MFSISLLSSTPDIGSSMNLVYTSHVCPPLKKALSNAPNVPGTHALYFGLALEKSLLIAKRYGEPHELIVSLSTGVVIPAVAETVAWHHCSSMLESSPWLWVYLET
jgi:hypothetical protein